LGFELLETVFNGPESELTKTDVTQPAIFAVSIAILRLIEQEGIKAQAAAG
jgi:[acyl-carrier-protein] S-malonyltransferase